VLQTFRTGIPGNTPVNYDAEALVSVLVGYLIQAGVPEPGLTRMMLDVIDELRRRDAGHSYPALRALAVIGPPGVAGYAAVAAGRLAARDAALPWIASIGDVIAGACHLATRPCLKTGAQAAKGGP